MTGDRFTHDPRDSRGVPGGAPTSFGEAKAAVDEDTLRTLLERAGKI